MNWCCCLSLLFISQLFAQLVTVFLEIKCIFEGFLQCRSKWSIPMKKTEFVVLFSFSLKFWDKKRGEREKVLLSKMIFQVLFFFCPLPRIFCNGDFKQKILLRAKEDISIPFFLFPRSLMYIEAVINSKDLCRNCIMLNPKCKCELGPERELGREEWLPRELLQLSWWSHAD